MKYKSTRLQLEKFDLFLIALVAVLVVGSAIVLFIFPLQWIRFLWLLDARKWQPWRCIGVAVVLIECLLLIRLWPNKDRST